MEQLEQRLAAGDDVTVEELSQAHAADRLAELTDERDRTLAAHAVEDQRQADLAAALDHYEAAADTANAEFLAAWERFEDARRDMADAFGELHRLQGEAASRLQQLGLRAAIHPDDLVSATEGRVLLAPEAALIKRDQPPYGPQYAAWLEARRAERQ